MYPSVNKYRLTHLFIDYKVGDCHFPPHGGGVILILQDILKTSPDVREGSSPREQQGAGLTYLGVGLTSWGGGSGVEH